MTNIIKIVAKISKRYKAFKPIDMVSKAKEIARYNLSHQKQYQIATVEVQ